MNYQDDVRIDENGLDTEWLQQPSLMMRYGKEKAAADDVVERAKHDFDVVRAQLDLAIRKDPTKYGAAEGVKITEAVVNALLIQNELYTEAHEEYLDAKHHADLAKVAVQAVDGKKTALENLVKLHGQQYFSSPSVPRDLSQEWVKKQEQKQSDRSVRIRRRSKE